MSLAKEYEKIIKQTFEVVPDVSIMRLYDPTSSFAGIKNICDYELYVHPYLIFLECKTSAGNTWNFSNLSSKQLEGMLEKSQITGILAGVILWFYEKDITIFVDIIEIKRLIDAGYKSINASKLDEIEHIVVKGQKKRTYFEYDGNNFKTLLKRASYRRWCK